LFIDEHHPRPSILWPDHVRVKVKAVSLNFATLLKIKGSYQEKSPLPFIPGSDFCGIIEEVGSGVSLVRIGDAVCGLGDDGSFAEELVISESNL
jgi:NADPH2:quinone reductase